MTVKSAKPNTKPLVPTWGMVMGYKRGEITEREYTQQYKNILARSQKNFRDKWERTIRNHKNVVFLCYCAPGEFCHRLLLAKEFVRFAIEELSMDNVHLVAERNPHPPTGPKKVTSTKENYYCGIGSRKTPLAVQKEMKDIAQRLEEKGFVLRSGGAAGADKAFESGVCRSSMKEIYRPGDCEPWCLEEVAKHTPPNRPPLEEMKSYVQKLLGRNMKQVLGLRGDSPVKFVICWTSDGKDSGGSGYAIRCAKAHGIPVHNLKNQKDREELYRKLSI